MVFEPENDLFSFLYDGRSCGKLMLSRSVMRTPAGETRICTFPDGLRITTVLTLHREHDAVEWVNFLENTGDAPTGLISDLHDCEISLPLAYEAPVKWTSNRPSPEEATHILTPRGSNLCADEFNYRRQGEGSFDGATMLFPGQRRAFSSVGGRSSYGDAPFFNIHKAGQGYFFALGWTGQWRAEFRRTENEICISAGMEETCFRLLPGEKIRVCSAVLMPYETPLAQSFNLWRRLVRDDFSPIGRPGRVREAPLSVMLWGGMETAEMLRRLEILDQNKIPADTVWIDAGWYGMSEKPSPDEFEGDWGDHTGDWRVNPHIHPDGLLKVAAAVRRSGRKLLLWAEPERVRMHTPLVQNHPDYFYPPENPAEPNRLLNLGNPEAWQDCFDTLSDLIRRLGLDWYRQDFNIDPLPFWRRNDAPERSGISEIKHINGLYRLWDALLERFPHLAIDNCASGGRRIDIETLRRSVPLWRSDMQCPVSCPPEISQAHALTFAEWLPFSGTGAADTAGTYGLRSCYAPALGIRAAYAQSRPFGDDAENLDVLRRRCAEFLRVRPYLSEDVYALTEPSAARDLWSARQYHRPSDDTGVLLCFRRAGSPYETARFPLQGVSAAYSYLFTDADTGEERTVSGSALVEEGFFVCIKEKPCSKLYFYQRDSAGSPIQSN